MRKALLLGAFTCAALGAAAQHTELSTAGAPLRFEAHEIRYFSFPARAGEGVSVYVQALAHTPDVESNSRLQVLNPDGSLLTGKGCRAEGQGGAPCKLLLPKMPVSGRYMVGLHPPAHSVASGAIAVSEDQLCRLEARRATVVNIRRPGQVARCTLEVRAGERIGFQIGAIERSVAPGNRNIVLTLRAPDGKALRSRMILERERDVSMAPQALPATGSYSVEIDPVYAALPSLTIAFTGR
jgi:hypothetical protein